MFLIHILILLECDVGKCMLLEKSPKVSDDVSSLIARLAVGQRTGAPLSGRLRVYFLPKQCDNILMAELSSGT